MAKGIWLAIIVVVVVGAYAIVGGGNVQAPEAGPSSAVLVPDAGNVPATTAAPALSVVNVAIRGFAYAPAEIRIAPGTMVVWTNEDSVRHNAVADGGAFSGPLLSQGESYEFTFTANSTYAYHCAPHPFMKATVVVE